MRAVTVSGRWVWGLSGLVTAVALAVPGTRLITMAGTSGPPPMTAVTRNVTVPQPVSSLTVQTYGGAVRVAAGRVSRVHVTETIMYDPRVGPLSAAPGSAPGGSLSYGSQAGVPPVVAQSVSGGRLSLGDPACASSDCFVNFTVTVPPDVTVTVDTQGDPVTVSGVAGANLNSGGGPVTATRIGGPLTVTTGGGPLTLTGLAGPLNADTDSGNLVAQGVAAATAAVSTGGGPAQIAFSAAPALVNVNTDGGSLLLTVPGGPYALSAESDGGPQQVGIATDPHARSSITVNSGGGPLQVTPAPGRG